MLSKNTFLSIIVLLISISDLSAQVTDSSSINILTRFSFYSGEKTAEVLIRLPYPLVWSNLNIIIKSGEKTLALWNGRPGNEIVRIQFALSDSVGPGKISVVLANRSAPAVKYTASCDLVILPHKSNEVKTDRLTGGLIVNGRNFFPFGFYCYSPVYPTLPEEEVVKGFNLMSPYQKILPETFEERKAYMDRCAMLGMKVNYNLLSVSGGGGVGSRLDEYSDQQKREMLVREIKALMDHPALLAWYIADEPTGNKVSPETIEEIYQFVKKTDPWHPVSVVFMVPFQSAKKYENGFDIAMADPYPIPDYPVTMAGDATSVLKKAFAGEKPVWIVPQTFGGGELWKREPTIQEIRSMTWQAIIQGATGVQFFIRNGLNSFPKSTAAWNECGRIALEVNSISPWLLSDEKSVPVQSLLRNVLVTSRMARGQLLIMAVNTKNEPVRAEISVSNYYSGKAKVVFENRSLNVNSGMIYDYLPAFGSQVYKIDLDPQPKVSTAWKENMMTDPGFEDITSPGIPSACYARPGGDRGATYLLDPVEKFEGDYSLRLITPRQDKSISIKFFPVKVKSGASYLISLWAKADPEQRFAADTTTKPSTQYVEAGMGDFGMSRFVPTTEWKQYVTIVTIPSDTLPEIKANVVLRMPGQGVAWFDLIQVIEDPLKSKK